MSPAAAAAPAGDQSILPPTETRVPKNTPKGINKRICHATGQRVKELAASAGDTEINRRLAYLKTEWDTERTLQANASTLIVVSLLMVRFFDHPGLIWLALGVAAFLLQHALQGWCPPLPVLRYLGFRTSYEIADEIAALQLLRNHGTSKARGEAAEGLVKELRYTGRMVLGI